jgi:hypothetical protein
MKKPKLSQQEQIDSNITTVLLLAVVSGALTLIVTLAVCFTDKSVEGKLNWLGLVDPVIIFGLAYGVYKRSRICAVLLVIYVFANEAYFISTNQFSAVRGIRLIIAFYYVRGMFAVFAHNRNLARIGQAHSLQTANVMLPAPPPTPISSESFFIFLADEVKGPFTLEQLHALLQVATICSDTPCCKTGTEGWVPAQSILS